MRQHSHTVSVRKVDDPKQPGGFVKPVGTWPQAHGGESGVAAPVEQVALGVRRQQGVHQRMWTGVDASRRNRASIGVAHSVAQGCGTVPERQQGRTSEAPLLPMLRIFRAGVRADRAARLRRTQPTQGLKCRPRSGGRTIRWAA